MIKVGYIGLGALGSALTGRLLSETAPPAVWDLSPDAMKRIEAKGGRGMASAAELARACDVVLVCLPRSSDVQQVIFGPDGLAEGLAHGTLVIDQTSGVPAQTRAMAERLQQQGIDMIDAAVSASPHIVAQGGAVLMVSGPDHAVERALPILHRISATVHRCGRRVGDGQAMKMVNNALNGGCRVGTLEIVALGRKLGLSLAVMSERLNAGSAANQTTLRMLPALIEGRTSTDFALSLMTKDLGQAVQLGMQFGVPMPITATVRSLLQIGLNTIGPAAKLEDVVSVIETLAGTRLAGDALDGIAPVGAADIIEGAVAAMATMLTFECVAAGLRYGLELDDMSRILVSASGWSESLRRILPKLAAGQRTNDGAVAVIATLRAAADAAIQAGAPTMVLNAVRSVAEAAVNETGAGQTLDTFARYTEQVSRVSFTAETSGTVEKGLIPATACLARDHKVGKL